MSKNLGSKFWNGVVDYLSGIDTWENDFENADKVCRYLDNIEKSVKTNADKEILAHIDVYNRNNEFIQPYFKECIMECISELYKK